MTPLHGRHVLLLEDETLFRKRVAAYLEAQGAEVTAVGTVAEARRALAADTFDVALCDVNLPDGLGTSLLQGAVPAATAFVVMTAGGGVDGAVEAVRLGAADYLVKPFDLDELPLRLARARSARARRRVEDFEREKQAPAADGELVFGRSLDGVRVQLERIVAADRRVQGALPPVLIEGETGTGKTVLARWLHANGPRAAGPLVEVNCSAVPENLAESELFGHEKGAFTDAKAARIGLMEAAEGGTLFLDELTSLPLPLQGKLLTALEDRKVRRIGATRPVPVDVRIIAATNADLGALVAQGRFREDLRQRLDLFRVRLPPLRERGEDVVALATTLAGRIAARYGLEPRRIAPEGRRRLLAHAWPGNVRELAHAVERAVVFEEGDLAFTALEVRDGASDGPAWLRPGWSVPEDGFSLEEATDVFVRLALEASGGNVSAAARRLGVTRDFLRYRLKGGAADQAE